MPINTAGLQHLLESITCLSASWSQLVTFSHLHHNFWRRPQGARRTNNCAAMDVQAEVKKLVEEINRLGEKGPDGKVSVKFVKLIDDERCGNIFEAIIGTLKAARRSNVLTFDGEFLLKGVHDDVPITLVETH